MPARPLDPEIGYARSRGLSVAYAVLGEGPIDLVVVPGFVSHIEGSLAYPPIARVFGRLSSFARLITFDKPGTGLSDPVSGAPTLEERMEDLHAVLDAVGSERTALFGYSEGGPMSVLFAASYPSRTSALVMFGSYARGSAAPDYPWAPGPEQVEAAAEMIHDGWGTGVWLDAYAPSLADDPATMSWWKRYQRQAASPAMAEAVTRLAAEIDVREVLPAISVPTLIMHRSGDLMWPLEGSRYLAEHIAGARFVELEGIDHIPFAGEVEPILAEVESFLTGTQRSVETERRLLTVLFTDIVSSTERAAELGDRRWRGLLERHDATAGGEIERHGGRAVKTMGDGFLATFTGPARAIACARALIEVASSLDLELRAGIHTGECEIVGDDISGMAVNIGARVGALAGAGEVLVSRTVKDLVVGSGLEFEPRGTHALKGVPGQWGLFAVATGLAGTDRP